ncbi:MAG: hypothetical protein ACKO3T_05115 [Planctomycetaceae bacterium]
MLTLLEKYMPIVGAFLFTLITVLGVLAWLQHRYIFGKWQKLVARETTGLGNRADYLLELLDGQLHASMITAALRSLTQLSPIAALALTAFTYRNLQLAQLQASQLTLGDVFAAMQPVYLPMSVLACVTGYSMLVTAVLRNQTDRIVSRARGEAALSRNPLEQPLEHIRELLNDMAREMQTSLSAIAEVMENCRRNFESLPELSKGTVQQVQAIVDAIPNQLETITNPLLQTARQTQSGLAGLNSAVGGICQNLQAAGDTLTRALEGSAVAFSEASTLLAGQQSRLQHTQHDLLAQASNATRQVQQFSQSLLEQGIEPLLNELKDVPGRIAEDLHSTVIDTVKAEFASQIQRRQAAAESARREQQRKAGTRNGSNGTASAAHKTPIPEKSQAEGPPAIAPGRLLRGFNRFFRKDADEGDN